MIEQRTDRGVKLMNGLIYLPDFITENIEREIIKLIDSKIWDSSLKRRVQHYGYEYGYKSKAVSLNEVNCPPIPNDFLNLKNEIEILTAATYDQLIINEYLPGQGISAHIDCIPCFENNVAILSLLSGCNMNFAKEDFKNNFFLENRSLLLLKDEARYEWKHSINPVKSDIVDSAKIKRNRRVSLTFRKVIRSK